MERYVAKPEQFLEGVETGRVGGVWNEDLLPVHWETVQVSLKDAYRIRRWFRRLAKMRGKRHQHRLRVSVRYENVVRLLEFLGYRWGSSLELVGDLSRKRCGSQPGESETLKTAT